MPHIVSFLNQKGGVGKTSTTFHLAGALASLGHKILLVDNDPQASLTRGIWGPTATDELDPSATIAAVYRGDSPFPGQVIHATGLAGIDLIPGSDASTRFNLPEPELQTADRQSCLVDLFSGHHDHDLILIDCPPNLHLCSWAALACSQHMVIPVQPEDYGAQGIPKVLASVGLVQSSINPELHIRGIILSMVSPRRAVHQLFETTLRQTYGELVFAARVADSPEFPEAILNRKPITSYKPKGVNARATRALATELLARIEPARLAGVA